MAESTTIVRNDSGIANEVLRRNVPLVVDSCHPNCVQLADKLYSKRMIPDKAWRRAKDTMSGHTIDQRISDMISVVRDSIRTDGSMFRTFTDILRTEDTLPHNRLADVLDKELI
uniref:CARD domain-containing protein n=1 Tax=Amphimedon queenslandica TaxID=400682 RepID=A0A1X7VN84_AMPQE